MSRLLLLILLSFLMVSCNDYQKLLNSSENEVDKYNAAEEYYEKGEFRRANALIEQISKFDCTKYKLNILIIPSQAEVSSQKDYLKKPGYLQKRMWLHSRTLFPMKHH